MKLRLDIACAGTVVAAAVAACYWKVVDSEIFMRLAIGRAIVGAGGVPERDPFMYPIPDLQFRNPESAGDVILYATNALGGEPALVALKLAMVAAGFLLLYRLGRKQGGTPVVLAGLIALALAASTRRFTERNEMFAYVMLPAYGLILHAARRDPRRVLALVPAGIIWANLHASFLLGWGLAGAALAEALFGDHRDRRLAMWLGGVLAIHPLLAFLTPDGIHAYDLIVDVGGAADVSRSLISEWRSPGELPATLSRLPLHLIGLLALASFLPRVNRRQVGALILVVAGVLMGQGSDRFIALFGMLVIPSAAANLARVGETLTGSREILRRAGTAALFVGGFLVLVPSVLRAHERPAAAERVFVPVGAARWLGTHAPPGSRIFNPYSGSQWLMWEAPQVSLYIYPQYTYSSEFLRRFAREIVPNPSRFDDEVAAHGIDLALVELGGGMRALASHLDASLSWRLLFVDGNFAIYGRRDGRASALIADKGYKFLRALPSFEYLRGAPVQAVEADLAQLRDQSGVMADVALAFQLLAGLAAPAEAPARPAVVDARRARDLLESALPRLPPAPDFFYYLAAAAALSDDGARARQAIDTTAALFSEAAPPGSVRALLPK